MLFYILSHLGSICWGLVCYSISCHRATPWQYLLGLGMLFYILSRLDSISLGVLHALLYLVTPWQYLLGLCMLYIFHILAVSAGAWHAILYLITPWQYPPKDQPPKTQATKAQVETQRTIPDCKSQSSITRATKAQVEQTEICRREGVGGTLWTCWLIAEEVVDLASGRVYSISQRGKFAKNTLAKNSSFSKIILSMQRQQVFMIRIDFTSMNSHVKLYALKINDFRKILFTSEFTGETKAATLSKF